MEPQPDCYACQLIHGQHPLPGGRIATTERWAVEHCTGPLGVGTLIVKPLRHCVHLGELSTEEATELGPLLRRASAVTQTLSDADQVYACLWSHADWKPGHLHFVVQPVRNALRVRYPNQGPNLQVDMFRDGEHPDPLAVEAFAQAARERWSGA